MVPNEIDANSFPNCLRQNARADEHCMGLIGPIKSIEAIKSIVAISLIGVASSERLPLFELVSARLEEPSLKLPMSA